MTYKKNQTIKTDEGNLLCIVADEQLAVFAKTSDRVDEEGYAYLHIDYEKVDIYDNTGTVKGPPIVEGHSYNTED